MIQVVYVRDKVGPADDAVDYVLVEKIVSVAGSLD
jgi:hypothetical protein